jgi:ATP-dependent DNA ligase
VRQPDKAEIALRLILPRAVLERLMGGRIARSTRAWRPVAPAVLDGEAVAGDGTEGIQAVFEARHRPGSPMAFAAFDLLQLGGHNVMGEFWTARRKRLEDLLEAPPPGICLVPVTDDAPALWDT